MIVEMVDVIEAVVDGATEAEADTSRPPSLMKTSAVSVSMDKAEGCLLEGRNLGKLG